MLYLVSYGWEVRRLAQRKLGYGVREAADAIGVSAQTLYRMIRSGEVKATRLRRRILIGEDELKRLLAKRE